MQELIKISKQQVGSEEVNAVSSMELHKTLEVKTQHSKWILRRIDDLGLIEGVDYLPIKIDLKLESGTKYAKDYILTLDAVKKIIVSEKVDSELKNKILSLIEFDIITVLNLIKDFDAADLPEDRYIYIAQEQESKRYKIGISKHPEERVRQLNIGNPEELNLIAMYKANEAGHLSETKVLKMLKQYKLRSEWVSSEADLTKIKEAI